MTASERRKSPDFFEDHGVDPVTTATRCSPSSRKAPKRKAGFYLSEHLLERFNRLFHQLKLAGAPIENKSALLELALTFALEDLDKGDGSVVLKTLKSKR